MRYLITFLAYLFCFSSLAQTDSSAIPNSGIKGLKDNLDRLISENKIDSALLYTGKLIQYYKNEGDYYEELRAVSHKAEILRHISSLAEAKSLMMEYSSVADTMATSTVKSVYYNRLAAILIELKELEAALKAVKRSQSIDAKAGYTWRKYSNWNIEGAIYRDQKQFYLAREVLERSAQYAKVQNDTNEYLTALYNLSHNYFQAKDFEQALEAAQAYLLTYPYDFTRMPADVAEIGAEAAQELGNHKLAFTLLDSAYEWRLQEMSEVIDSRVEALKMTDHLEKARLEGDILRSQKEADHFRIVALASFLSIATLLVIVFFLSSRNYKERHSRQTEQNERMQESLEFKDKLISIVAHDIRNPVASIRGMLQLYSQGMVKTNELIDWMDGLETSVANVDLLLENLLNWVKAQRGQIEAHIESINITPILNQTAAELHSQLELKKIELDRSGLPTTDLNLNADPNILSFAFRNILSNAIKFSEEGAAVKLRLEELGEFYKISVQDHGKGMSSQQIEAIMQKKAESTRGTRSEKGSGMGLGLSQEFLLAMGARFAIESQLGEGTTLSIMIPKNLA